MAFILYHFGLNDPTFNTVVKVNEDARHLSAVWCIVAKCVSEPNTMRFCQDLEVDNDKKSWHWCLLRHASSLIH